MYATFDPTKDETFVTHEKVPTLEDLQAAVGGLIEPVMLFEDKDGCVDMYVNEEGLYMCEPTLALLRDGYGPQVIHGPVVFARLRYRDGKTVKMTTEDIRRLERCTETGRFLITQAGLLPTVEVVD